MDKAKVIPRTQVKIRLHPSVVKRLRLEAIERAVPLSEVIEQRLEQSLDRSGLLYEVLALGYGKNVATIFTMAEENKLLKLRDADKSHIKKCFDAFLDQVGKGRQ